MCVRGLACVSASARVYVCGGTAVDATVGKGGGGEDPSSCMKQLYSSVSLHHIPTKNEQRLLLLSHEHALCAGSV